MDNDISNLRRDFLHDSLRKKHLCECPYDQFKKWFDQACEDKKILDPNAMILSTIHNKNDEHVPNSRIVLLKEYKKDKGFTFFTNYESPKAKQIEENNNASLLFFWSNHDRQIRILGKAKKVSNSENKKYFNSRPLKSRIGSLASNQSKEISNRDELMDNYDLIYNKYKKNEDIEPKNWGGFIIFPNEFEFWQGGINRLHDRFLYKNNNSKDSFNTQWKITRLSP